MSRVIKSVAVAIAAAGIHFKVTVNTAPDANPPAATSPQTMTESTDAKRQAALIARANQMIDPGELAALFEPPEMPVIKAAEQIQRPQPDKPQP